MTWIDDNKRPLMAVGAILGVAWFGGRYFDKNQSFNAEESSDAIETFRQIMMDVSSNSKESYDDYKNAPKDELANHLLEMWCEDQDDLDRPTLGSSYNSYLEMMYALRKSKKAETFDAERIQYNYVVHREPKGSSKGGWFKSKKAETFNAENEGMYFVFADGTTMIEAADADNGLFLQWKIPYSEIRDYVNEWTDNLKEDQEWRLNPYDVAHDFAYDKWEDEPYGMNWAENIRDAVNSRIPNDGSYVGGWSIDEPMTKAEIRSFLTGIPSSELTKKAETFEAKGGFDRNCKVCKGTGWMPKKGDPKGAKTAKSLGLSIDELTMQPCNAGGKDMGCFNAETFEANDICHRSCYDGHEWRLSGTSHLGEYTTDGKPILNWRCDSCGQSKSSPNEPKSKADTHDWEMTKTKNWGDGVFTIYAECKRCGVKGYADGDVEESIDIQHPSLRAETFEAKGDCAECYGTGGLYDSHMGINDECHSCGGTGFDY